MTRLSFGFVPRRATIFLYLQSLEDKTATFNYRSHIELKMLSTLTIILKK